MIINTNIFYHYFNQEFEGLLFSGYFHSTNQVKSTTYLNFNCDILLVYNWDKHDESLIGYNYTIK